MLPALIYDDLLKLPDKVIEYQELKVVAVSDGNNSIFSYTIEKMLIDSHEISEQSVPVNQLEFDNKNKIAEIIFRTKQEQEQQEQQNDCKNNQQNNQEQNQEQNQQNQNNQEQQDQNQEQNQGEQNNQEQSQNNSENQENKDQEQQNGENGENSEKQDSQQNQQNQQDQNSQEKNANDQDQNSQSNSQESQSEQSQNKQKDSGSNSESPNNSQQNDLNQKNEEIERNAEEFIATNKSDEISEKEKEEVSQETLEQVKENLSYLNTDQNNNNRTYGGPADDITKNRQNSNQVIKLYLSRLIKKKSKVIKQKSHEIDGKKAAIALIAKPHMFLEMKKLKHKKAKVYALIDTHTSSSWGYGDDGKFLNAFAQSCKEMGIITWRAEKLSKNYRTEDGRVSYDGVKTHNEWAKLAKIKKGSFVILVGDGCLGDVGDSRSSNYVWNVDETKKFADKYNPFWVHYYDEHRSCGCKPKDVAMASGWEGQYGIKNVNSLELQLATSG